MHTHLSIYLFDFSSAGPYIICMGYVYLIHEPSTDNYKIGVTTGSIEKRMKKLQTGNSSELILSNSYECEYPFKLEMMLHNYFRNKKVLNEWYALDRQDLGAFTSICETLDKNIHALKDNPFFFRHKRLN